MKPSTRPPWRLLILAVVFPGLIIGGLGIYFVSQQKRNLTLNKQKELTSQLNDIRQSLETETQSAIDNVFSVISSRELPLNDPRRMAGLTKDLVLNHPVIAYPFFITKSGGFIFPVSKRVSIPVTAAQPVKPPGKPGGGNLFSRGERLELEERKPVDAIRHYKRYINQIPARHPFLPYVFNAVARCYFKMGQYRQTLYYYHKIREEHPGIMQTDPALRFLVLRQSALTNRQLGDESETVRAYLLLYESLLEYAPAAGDNRYELFKIEARDYLDRFAKTDAQLADRFLQAREKEKARRIGERGGGRLGDDLSMGWMFFEDAGSTRRSGAGTGREASRFAKLREFYMPNDEKTAFYKAVKNHRPWTAAIRSGKPSALSVPFAAQPLQIAVMQLPATGSGTESVYFGFALSPDFFKPAALTAIADKNRLDKRLRLLTVETGKPDKPRRLLSSHPFELFALPGQGLLTGKRLIIRAPMEHFIDTEVEKEIRLLYGLMAVLSLALLAGLFLFYKYVTREAELMRLKAQFVDSVSHTLKTPLTRMALLAENVQQGWVTDPKQKDEFFKKIISETTLMNEMVNNMLDFSRIDAGKKTYRFSPASLTETVEAVLSHYADYLEGLGFQLDISLPSDIPLIPMDADALRLVIGNLVQNAVTYSDETKHMAIRAAVEGAMVRLEIRDRGIGIPQKELTRIFKRFHRVDSDQVRARSGSGLGLFIVAHAVAAHGGHIRVESQLGEGTTFIIHLPMEQEE